MPSMDVMTSAAATASAASEKSQLLSLDVEHLVSEIKENLRLSGFKSRRHRTHFARSTKPYAKPSACESYSDRQMCRCNDDTQANDDPYEMLQALLREGSLVKEAVRRLQIGFSPKQRYYYESDEESSRSPKFRLC